MSSSITISTTPCARATDLAVRHAMTQALLVRERYGSIQDRIEIEVPAWDELGGLFVFELRGRPGAPLELQLRDYAPELLSDAEDREERGFRGTLSSGESVIFAADPNQECPVAVALVGLATLGFWWCVESAYLELWVHDCGEKSWDRVAGPVWAICLSPPP